MVRKTMLVLALLCLSCSSSVQLPVTPIKQSTRYWCWASTLAMVGQYYKNYPMRDCDIVGSNNFVAIGKILHATKCCEKDIPVGRHPACYRGGQIWDFILALDKILKLRYDYLRRPLTREEIIKHLEKKHLIICLRKLMTNHHANLIIGYDEKTDLIAIAEPTPGKIIYLKYKEFIANLNHGIWEDTFVIVDKPATAPMCAMKCLGKECAFKMLECLPNL